MDTLKIKENLIKAFGVETSEELSKHLTKTDLDSRTEMLHAAAVLYSYGDRYDIKDESFISKILDNESDESRHKLAIDAKHGYGYHDYCQQQGLEVNSKESYAFFGYS
ncbi:MAG: hypothetical protein ACRC2V_07730 [Xenococcaceae cyanobacterium]